tara:strand:+ start:6891 stop:7607 length:717 start_codon:yes stop_codon:yes gene_type:complete
MFKIDRNEKNPNSISVDTGLTCNLACVICGPDASSLWQDKLKKYSTRKNNLHEIDQLDFSNATNITVGGGEPVLNKSTIPILKKIVRSNIPHVPINIHFNCTAKPSAEFLEACRQIKRLDFTMSLDDTEQRFEFLRWPAKWDKAVENIRWMVANVPEHITFSTNTVITRLNEHTYHTVETWVRENIPEPRINWIGTNEAFGRLSRVENLNGIAQWLDMLDSSRKTDWRATFPLAHNIT